MQFENLCINNMDNMDNIGNHIKKYETILKSLKKYYEDKNFFIPCQIFLSSPIKNSCNIDKKDVISTKKYIETNNIKCYVHAPYIINMCDNNGWNFELLKKQLILAKDMNMKGIVVHVGKSCKKKEEEALKIMYEFIKKILEYSTESCPLILETPAHQGTELLWKVEDMYNFYSKFNEEERKKFKICVDTCHVFASGYDPLEYIILLKSVYEDCIALIHLNDSKEEKGSRKDRHEFIGNGKIGKSLIEIIYYNNIDKVSEF